VARLLLVSGSLRARSTNTAVLATAARLLPAGVEVLSAPGPADLPHFNPDDDVDPLPPAVAGLRAAVHAADGVLFCVPEYAGALPGSFKNLLDWTIGDDRSGSLNGKPVAWINASPRGAGAAHASLRAVLGYAGAAVVEAACLDIPVTANMLDGDGLVADAPAVEGIRRSVTALAAAGGGPGGDR
jgi:chromate reductase